MPSAPAASPHLITSLTVGGEAIDDPFDIDGGGASLVKITYGSLVRGQKYSVVGIKEYEDITFTAKYIKTEYLLMVTKRDAKTEIELAVDHRLPAVLHLPASGGALADHLDHQRACTGC